MADLPAPARPLSDALSGLSSYGRSCMAAARQPASLIGWRLAIVAVWAVGIVADIVTTVAMMRSGQFEEANPVGALGMGQVGMLPYVCASSVFCSALCFLGLGRARRSEQVAVQATIAALGVLKLAVAGHNGWIWYSATR